MAQNKLYRILSVAVMATVLTALLALTALADVSGGFGQILGLDAGKTYTATPVTINTTGDGMLKGEAFELTADTNKNLAGLFIVSDGETESDIIYVYGDLAKRADLGNTIAHEVTTGGDKGKIKIKPVIETGTEWKPGTWVSAKGSNWTDAGGWADLYDSATKYFFGSTWIQNANNGMELFALTNPYEVSQEKFSDKNLNDTVNAYYNNYYNYTDTQVPRVDENGDPVLSEGTPKLDPETGDPILDPETDEPVIDPETQVQIIDTVRTYGDIKDTGIARAKELQELTKGIYEAFSFKYAYEPEEIIPVSELETFPYYVKAMQWYLFPSLAKAQAVFYVMDKDGNVTTHTWTSNYMTITNSSSTAILNTVIDVQSIAGLPSEGWIVGVDVKPFGVAEADSVKAVTTGNKGTIHASQFLYDFTWSKYVTSIGAPEGVVLNGKKYTGLKADENYIFAPVNANGADKTRAIKVTGVTEYTIPADTTGLWGLFCDVEGDVDVHGVPVYVYGDYAKRAKLHEFDSNGILIPKTSDNLNFNIGEVSGNDGMYKINSAAIQTESGLGSGFTSAIAAAATKDEQAKVLLRYENTIKNYAFVYGFTDEEIVPISDVNSYDYQIFLQRVYSTDTLSLTYENLTMRFDAYVMGTDGKIRAYTYLEPGNRITVSGYAKCEIDFNDASKWVTPLPEEGYLVGIKSYPLYGMTNAEDLTVTLVLSEGSTKINTSERLRFIYYVGTYSIDKPAAAAPDAQVEGTVVTGLDAAKTYTIAPYLINGVVAGEENANVKTVTGVTSVDIAALYSTPVGLYAVQSIGDDIYGASEPVLVYVPGSFSARQALYELYSTDKTTNAVRKQSGSTDNFVIGTITQKVRFSDGTGTSLYNKETLNTDISGAYGLLVETHFSWTTIKDFCNATTAGEKTAGFNKIKNIAQTIVYRYALTSEEVIPVSEVQKLTFGFNLAPNLWGINGFTYLNGAARFEAYIMDNNGEISTYSYVVPVAKMAYNTPSKCVADFTDADGWDKPLPEDGWFVGYALYPYHGFTNPDNLTISLNENLLKDDGVTPKYTSDKVRTYLYLYHGEINYVIYQPKAEISDDIALDGTLVTGLETGKTYNVYSVNVLGIDKTSKKTITAENNDLATVFENSGAGLYAITVAATEDFAESDSIILFVQGTYEENKKLGTYAEGKSYPTSYGNTTGTAPNTVTHPEWEIGYFRAPRMGQYNYTSVANPYLLAASPVTYIYDWIYESSKTTEVYDAQEDEDPTVLADLQASMKTTLEKINFRYAYTPEEIIPVGEFASITVAVVRQNQNHFNVNAKGIFALEVADNNGVVTEYFATSDERTIDNSEDVYKFTRDDVVKLPEEGYIVGFRFYPWGDVDAASISATTREPVGSYALHFGFNPEDYLLIQDLLVPIVEKDEPYRDWASATHYLNDFYITNYLETVDYKYSYGTADAAGTEWFDVTSDLIVARENSKYVWVKAIYNGVEGMPQRSDKPAEAIAVEGINLVLDGTIGVQVNFNYDPEVVESFHVYCNANIDSFDKTYYAKTMADGVATVIVPFNAKDVNNVTYSNNLVYKRKDETGTRNLEGVGAISVRSYVNTMKENAEEYAEWLPLIEALETYYNYADYYFDDEVTTVDEITLSAEEQLFVNEAVPTKEGEVDGIKHHSTSIILESSTTLRHYFKIDDINTIGNYTVTVNGVAAQFVAAESAGTNSYVYVDIANIPAEELDDVQIVSVNGVVVVNCSAVGYTNLAQHNSNAKLRNLAKAVAQYAYAANQMK